jgi:hypothetical protein
MWFTCEECDIPASKFKYQNLHKYIILGMKLGMGLRAPCMTTPNFESLLVFNYIFKVKIYLLENMYLHPKKLIYYLYSISLANLFSSLSQVFSYLHSFKF